MYQHTHTHTHRGSGLRVPWRLFAAAPSASAPAISSIPGFSDFSSSGQGAHENTAGKIVGETACTHTHAHMHTCTHAHMLACIYAHTHTSYTPQRSCYALQDSGHRASIGLRRQACQDHLPDETWKGTWKAIHPLFQQSFSKPEVK